MVEEDTYAPFQITKGGYGHLVKCYKDKIVKDFSKGDLRCQQYEGTFARETMIRGNPAYKIAQGKVFVKK